MYIVQVNSNLTKINFNTCCKACYFLMLYLCKRRIGLF